MDLCKYIKENAIKLDDGIVLSEVGEGKVVLALDRVTLEQYLEGFIRNKLNEGDLRLLPTCKDKGLKEMAKEAIKQGIHPYPKEVAVEVEIFEDPECSTIPELSIYLEPFFTVEALRFFEALPPEVCFKEDNLLSLQYVEFTDSILDFYYCETDVTSEDDRDVRILANFLSQTFGDKVEYLGYISTRVLFSISESNYDS